MPAVASVVRPLLERLRIIAHGATIEDTRCDYRQGEILARGRHFSSIGSSPNERGKATCPKPKAAASVAATRRPHLRTHCRRPRGGRPCRRCRASHREPAPAPKAAKRKSSASTVASLAGVAPDDGVASAAALCVVPPEAIGEELLEIRVFLPHKAALGQRAFAH